MINEFRGQNLWTEPKSRPGVVVVGGTGHVGAALCRFLSGRGHRVVSASRSDSLRFDDLNIEHICFDVMDSRMEGMLPEAQVAVICPWVSGTRRPTTGAWVDRLVHMLAESDTRTVIYLSTIWVYGETPSGLLTESTPLVPTSSYGMAHAANEATLRVGAAELGVDVSILRMANLVGNDPFFRLRKKIAFAHELMEMAVSDHRIVLRSPPSTPRNMLPRGLFHHDICSLIDRPHEKGREEVFNLGSCSTSSVLDLAAQIARIAEHFHGRKVEIEHPEELTPQATFQVDTARIRSLAGPAPDDLVGELSMILQDVTASSAETRLEGKPL